MYLWAVCSPTLCCVLSRHVQPRAHVVLSSGMSPACSQPVLTVLPSVAQRCIRSWSASPCPPSPSHLCTGPRPNMLFLPWLFCRKGPGPRPMPSSHSHPEHRSKILPTIHATTAVQRTLNDSIPSSVRFLSDCFCSYSPA